MEKVLNQLRFYDDKFPREALIEAVNMKDEITEPLLEELDQVIESLEIATEDEDYLLHIYSIYLLAQFREKKAFKPIIDLVSSPPDEVELLLGDIITEDLSSILYSTFDGNFNLLQALIENPLLNIYVRGAGLATYGKLYSDRVISKEDFISYLRSLIFDKPYDVDSDIATDVQAVVIERHILEMIDDIQFLYDEDRIDTGMYGDYDEFIDLIYSHNNDNEQVRYIDDIIQEIHWWSCFE